MEEPPTQSFLYETLPALSLPTPNQSPPPPEDLEPYSVFRNEITLSTPHCAPFDTAAPDFFSLNVVADEPNPIRASSSSDLLAEPWPPLHQSEPTTPAPQEPKLESGWFRGHCKFRSPMLQLHKGTFCNFNCMDIHTYIYLLIHGDESSYFLFCSFTCIEIQCISKEKIV